MKHLYQPMLNAEEWKNIRSVYLEGRSSVLECRVKKAEAIENSFWKRIDKCWSSISVDQKAPIHICSVSPEL
jgi:hypothetical protein